MPRWVKDAKTGQAVFEDDNGLVHLKDAISGEVKAMPAGEAAHMLADPVNGFKPATADDINRGISEREAGGKSSALGAAARGAAVGVVGGALAAPKLVTALGSQALGTEDPLAEISGRQFYADMAAATAHLRGGDLAAEDEARANARGQLLSDLEAHPYATTAGEIAGTLVGGAPLGAGARGLAAGGARLAGLTGTGARLATGVGTGVLEGGAFGADAASEAAWVKNTPATAQQTLAAIGLGALFGGGISLGAAGAAKLPGAVTKLLRRGEEAGGVEGAALAEEAGARPILATEEKAAPAAIDQVPDSMGSKARTWLNDVSDEAAVDAISRGNKPALKRLGNGEAPILATKRETGAILHELGVLAPGRSENEMFQLAEQAATTNGKKMGAVLDQLDKEAGYADGTKLVDSLADVAHRFESDAKIAWGPEGESVADFIRQRTATLEEKSANGILTHSDLHEYRMYLDDLAKWNRATPGPAADAAREMRQLVSETLKDEIQKASPELRAEWDLANKRFGAARWAEDTLGERVSVRNGANRLFSPSDYGTTAVAVLSGHPALAVAAGLGNKLFRERGYSTFAAVAKRLAGEAVDVGAAPAAVAPTARKLSALVANSMESVQSGIGTFLGGGERGAGLSRAARVGSLVARMRSGDINDARAAYAEHAEQVQQVASNPDLAMSRMRSIVGDTIPAYAPALYGSMVETAARGTQYLAAHAPAPAQDPDSITPQVATPPPVSRADIATYLERVEGVENPLSLLEDLNGPKGIRPEKVDAVKTVHPEFFESVRQAVFTAAAERTTPIPRRKRITLDIALDAGGAIEPSLRPQNLATMRMAGTVGAQQAPTRMPPMGQVPQASASLRTRSQQIMQGR